MLYGHILEAILRDAKISICYLFALLKSHFRTSSLIFVG